MIKLKSSPVFFIIVLFTVLISSESFSQTKVGYIDSKKILESMQDSRDAKMRLDNLVTQWQSDLKVLQDSLKLIKEDFEKKKLILTDQLKQQTEKKIGELETAVNNFKIQKFGETGEYFLKQTEFMKPVQDRIFKAIETVAKDGSFDYVFDRSSDILLLYVNENYDLTAKVIKEIEGK
ncbi:MAG: OmpH family outer membrane protein [Ignavibacteria bacterium]|nr:OmpH family outer membrane protein [Ignavibacteria bacterium]MBK7254266.1 OmpH family outer membrane protein [Ignavibacteria bacterium]MBK7446432.1 OmpH family outer membrane protein [Ignavibacteria bacterium]MBK8380358.1 OmpH family outer membrane protein [Ignavibacteria bacterium]MBK9405089.1 OmpH family outer membrane protein [Ignavibacteria bacterium]